MSDESQQPLPIDPLLPEVVASLKQHNSLVVEAPPGAGKTTRVPRAILDSGLVDPGEVWVLQPRRLAARLAAQRVASEMGESLGQRVGYQVRFEQKSSRQTRLRFMTEGLLLRKLLADPTLAKVGALVFDEFHERHLDGDIGLALARRLQATVRSDLRLVVMSATLDAEPVAAFLDDCPRIRAAGRQYAVDIEHAEHRDDRPLEKRVQAAVRRLVAGGEKGHLLVFLPGVDAIRRAEEACDAFCRQHGVALLPLHGRLPPAEQERAVQRSAQQKVILSTNVAETSVTIDGVAAVVDSGLAHQPVIDPWSGVSALRLQEISKASATQRAGRAGRTRAGSCVRLYTRRQLAARPDSETPEVARLDLTSACLQLAALGTGPVQLEWLDAPPAVAIDRAIGLLQLLGLVDEQGRITALGRASQKFPLHPRHARLVLEAQAQGVGRAGCAVAALLEEPDILSRDAPLNESGPSDVLALYDRLLAVEFFVRGPSRARAAGLRPGAAHNLHRAVTQLQRQLGDKPGTAESDDAEPLLRAILAAYPDRVAQATEGGGQRRGRRQLKLAGGGRAEQSAQSVVRAAPWVVVVAARARGQSGDAIAHQVSAIEPDWLFDLGAQAVNDTCELLWNDGAGRVEQIERLRFGELSLTESRSLATPGDDASALLFAAARRAPAQFEQAAEILQLRSRIATLAGLAPELGLTPVEDSAIDELLLRQCQGCVSLAELRRLGLADALRAQLGGEANARLVAWLPNQITLPGGRKLQINYDPDKPPWVASYLQDFFGLGTTPAVADGRLPLTVHLWAPNRRAVQITTDLAGFWQRHYPTLRKQLSRRYPRHAWPEDPRTATPPSLRGRRRKR